MAKFRVVTLSGNMNHLELFEEIQSRLTFEGNIVLPSLQYDYSSNVDLWVNMPEERVIETINTFNDMDKDRIDMSDVLFVINPSGHINLQTWSNICYAKMIGKAVDSLEPISEKLIQMKIYKHYCAAERLAWQQADSFVHLVADYPSEEALLNQMVTFTYKGEIIIDPWIPDDDFLADNEGRYPGHANKRSSYSPFKIYGKKKVARFIENLNFKHEAFSRNSAREELLDEMMRYCEMFSDYGVDFEREYSDDMIEEDILDWINCWCDFNPFPGID